MTTPTIVSFDPNNDAMSLKQTLPQVVVTFISLTTANATVIETLAIWILH